MEMPVLCDNCKEWVELNSMRESELTKGKLLCIECYNIDSQVKHLKDEIDDIQYMLDNNDPEIKGDRRGWKRNIKELKAQIIELGFIYDDL